MNDSIPPADTPLIRALIRDAALRFGLVWDENTPIPPAAITPAGIRIGVILDRLQSPADGMMRPQSSVMLAGMAFFPAEGYLTRDGHMVRLTEKERDVLLILLESGGSVVSRETLLRNVWGYASDVETHTLETHIYRLRHKIETDPGNPVLLVTAGEGYRLAITPET